MALFAEGTEVPVERSKAEIEKTATKYGASGFGTMSDDERHMAAVVFVARGMRVMFKLPLAHDEDPIVRRKRGASGRKSWETLVADENRRRWRALCLCIKAKLEAVASGIVTFEEEFLPHFVTASGQTVGEVALPQYLKALESGKPLPPLLGM